MLMLDRDGNLIYINKSDKVVHTISPINAMIDENIIIKFTPMHACYIGILASTHKPKKHNQKASQPLSGAHLTIVK